MSIDFTNMPVDEKWLQTTITTATGVHKIELTDMIRAYIPGYGLYIGSVGWAIAPQYMAKIDGANAESDK